MVPEFSYIFSSKSKLFCPKQFDHVQNCFEPVGGQVQIVLDKTVHFSEKIREPWLENPDLNPDFS